MTVSAKQAFEDPKLLLHAVIEKARQSGFMFKNVLDEGSPFSITSFNEETGRLVLVFKNLKSFQLVYDSIYLLFFDTSFARAIFGKQWEEELDALAIAQDKLQYLAQHLKTLNDEQ